MRRLLLLLAIGALASCDNTKGIATDYLISDHPSVTCAGSSGRAECMTVTGDLYRCIVTDYMASGGCGDSRRVNCTPIPVHLNTPFLEAPLQGHK